jgi:orotate phosphoribosyltransferase
LNFRSVAQLSDQVLRWSHHLPRDIEVVAGIPRSGMLAASMLALYLNVPLTDAEGLLEGRCFTSGTGRRKRYAEDPGAGSPGGFLSTPRKVLVVDDSVLSGRSMREVRERVRAENLPHSVRYGAVYVLPGHTDDVDHFCEVLNGPRVFEWNLLHGELVRQFCVSLDGVLSRRPSEVADADEGATGTSIRHARPYLVPTVEVGWVVSDRPEQDRSETEAWLEAQGIRYRELVMDEHRLGHRQPGAASAFKADVYRSTGASLFVEGGIRQSVEIANLSGRHVLSTEAMRLIEPGMAPLSRPMAFGDLHPPAPSTIRESLARLARRVARAGLPDARVEALRSRWAPRTGGE